MFGERNSGTTFLTRLLQENGIDVFDGAEHKKLIFVWKHGKPQDYLKLISDRVINIFIIRSLDEWLISIFNNPHNMAQPKDLNFKNFLTYETVPSGYVSKEHAFFLKNGKLHNHIDYRKDVFEIRYEKIKSYISFNTRHSDVVFVKLDYIRNKDNCHHFLNEMNKKYRLGMTNIIPEITYNVKSGEPGKKGEYDTVIDEETRKIIDRLKNDIVEEWIENLTFEMS